MRETSIRAIIFDLYNTLCDNGPAAWRATFEAICREQGLDIDPGTVYERWRSLESATRRGRVNLEDPDKSPAFRPYQQVWEACFVKAFAELAIKGDARRAVERVLADMAHRPLYPETRPVLAQLEATHRLGLLSNADEAFLCPFLEHTRLPFRVTLSSEAVGAYKPHPRGFQRVLDYLGVAPEEAMYVGDTLLDDVAGARRVGMGTALMARNGTDADMSSATPDYVIADLWDLLAIVRRDRGGAQRV